MPVSLAGGGPLPLVPGRPPAGCIEVAIAARYTLLPTMIRGSGSIMKFVDRKDLERAEMTVVVRIPTPLRKYTDGLAEVNTEGSTIREVFTHLEKQHAGLQEKIFDDGGEIRRFINVFVNGEDVRHQKGADTPVHTGDEVSVVPAIAGGR